jgi:hypothetical protein
MKIGSKNIISSGKLTVCYGKSQFLMGKLTIAMENGPFFWRYLLVI